jgi:hypothetical protein
MAIDYNIKMVDAFRPSEKKMFLFSTTKLCYRLRIHYKLTFNLQNIIFYINNTQGYTNHIFS